MLSAGSSAVSGTPSSSLNNNSYSNERSNSSMDVEFASDPASGGFFNADYKKHDDLKQMLDSNKDSLKLEAMKRIIGMIAKGKDGSDLFPAVVKNVVSKNIEVKKLVYVYLVRYAEEQQDLALLSISTFQRALKDPNQLIRASALRVLSSIRVSMIVPIVMLAIRDSASDMSPYVRKTAAHAIPKLFCLDAEQKDELITVIEKLLADRTTLVVGSAVMAFEEVCPERTDLIHKNYRKLCNLLVDVDEWGQILIINMLTRYARTQFTNPNIDDIDDIENPNKPFYDETSSDTDSQNNKKERKGNKKPNFTLDVDHRTLLRQTKPLLQSRNSSVVMSVAQLYHHIAPKNEVNIVAKALVRLLRSHKEIQSVVLTSIASMSIQRKSIFEPYMKSFFVRASDATHIKLLKLDILTNLATETSITVILREFQTYISSDDKKFVAATIQAIGRCAASISEVTETCLSGLVHLLSNKDEYVVAESVVVVKKLLQTQEMEHFEIISQMAKLLNFITVPAARSAILWLIGEYNQRIPNIAPDVLRLLAKSFVDEQDVVKLQVLNLAVKLYLTNPEQTELLCHYVFSLARYDQNYDIRDRARFLKQFIFPANKTETCLSKHAAHIFLAPKPAPTLESNYHGREQFQLGSMSHYLKIRVNGYNDLPAFPEIAPDSTVRNIEPVESTSSNHELEEKHVRNKPTKAAKSRSFYSESEKSSAEDSTDSFDSSSEEEDEEESGGSESDAQANGGVAKKPPSKKIAKKVKVESENDDTEDSEEDSDTDESDNSESESEDDADEENDDEGSNKSISLSSSEEASIETKKTNNRAVAATGNKEKAVKSKSNLELLLDLDDIPPMGPVMTPSLGGFLTPMSSDTQLLDKIELVGPSYISTNHTELLNHTNGYGLGVTYRFTRAPHLFSASMISIELVLKNHGNKELTDIRIDQSNLASGVLLNEFPPIDCLAGKQTNLQILGIDFNDSSQAINFGIRSSEGLSKVTIKSPVGELIRSVAISETLLNTEKNKLRGMTEHSSETDVKDEFKDVKALKQRIFQTANLCNVFSSSENVVNFAGHTMKSKSLVLVTIVYGDANKVTITVNCEKMVIGSMLLNELKESLKS